jgi:exodeoxyribonuclease VII small subunit
VSKKQKTTTEGLEPFSLEEKLREIREILQKMQMGANDFDENIKLFTQGTAMIADCRKYLDTAEMSVKLLIHGPKGPETTDFE